MTSKEPSIKHARCVGPGKRGNRSTSIAKVMTWAVLEQTHPDIKKFVQDTADKEYWLNTKKRYDKKR